MYLLGRRRPSLVYLWIPHGSNVKSFDGVAVFPIVTIKKKKFQNETQTPLTSPVVASLFKYLSWRRNRRRVSEPELAVAAR